MSHIRNKNPLRTPRILGLSATLLNANIPKGGLGKTLKKLEDMFGAEILTSKYSKEILMKFVFHF